MQIVYENETSPRTSFQTIRMIPKILITTVIITVVSMPVFVAITDDRVPLFLRIAGVLAVLCMGGLVLF